MKKKIGGIFFIFVFLFTTIIQAQELKTLKAQKYKTPKEVIELQNEWGKAKTSLEKFELIKKQRDKYPDSVIIHQIYQDYFERLTRRKRKELISEYKSLLEKNLKKPLYHYLYGRLLNNSSSLKYFKKSIELNKNFYWGYISLGFYYSNLVKKPDYEKAIKYFHKAINIDNSNPAAFLNLAEIYEKQGNINKAGEMYELLLKCVPENNSYFEKSLERYFLKGDYEKVIELIEKRIEKYPSDRLIMILGQLYFQKKNYPKSIEYLSRIASNEQEINYSAHAMLCIAYAQTGEKEKALDSFEKALLSPDLYFSEEIFEKKEFDPIKNEPRFKKAVKNLKDKLGINKPAKNFSLVTLSGENIELKKLKGKVVLLDFWATWCEPCIREMPNIMKLHQEFKDKDLIIIGLSVDKEKKELEEFLKKQGIKWPQIYTQSESNRYIISTYNVRALPATFLIDKKGILRKINLRGEPLRKALQKLIEEKK
jgi:tetratricopeptide (TPR) repeat protein